MLYTGNVCYARGVIGKDYVFVNPDNQQKLENALVSFKSSVENTVANEGVPQSCVDEILSLTCFNLFPACDYGHPVSRPRQVRILVVVM